MERERRVFARDLMFRADPVNDSLLVHYQCPVLDRLAAAGDQDAGDDTKGGGGGGGGEVVIVMMLGSVGGAWRGRTAVVGIAGLGDR